MNPMITEDRDIIGPIPMIACKGGWVPDWSHPGTAERVSIEVDDAEFLADPPRSNIGWAIHRYAQAARRDWNRGIT
jgi:hypothetical protein